MMIMIHLLILNIFLTEYTSIIGNDLSVKLKTLLFASRWVINGYALIFIYIASKEAPLIFIKIAR